MVTSAMSVEAMQASTHATYVPSLSRDLLISLKGVGVIQESTCYMVANSNLEAWHHDGLNTFSACLCGVHVLFSPFTFISIFFVPLTGAH